ITIDTINPDIYFVLPTPEPNEYRNEDYAYINVTAIDTNNITAFIDWNNSLVGWWRFNNESGENNTYFKDWSSYENNGTCTNCPNYTTGYFGKGMEFDGINDSIVINDSTSVRVQNFTIDGWIYRYTKPFVNEVIIGKRYDGIGGWENSYALYSNGTDIYTFYGYFDGSVVNVSSGVSLPIGKWTYFAATYNSTAVSLYVDGILKKSQSISGVIGYDNHPVLIGADDEGNPTYEWYVNGSIDEVKIWNRALTSEEINASYNAGLYRLETNYTSLADGTYNYTAYAQDLAGNINNTETRAVTIDTVKPDLYFIPPTYPNNSFINNNYTYINWSLTEANPDTTIFNWDDTTNTTTSNT
ncbi:MAG: LamG domain-containing protein, partial [Candidatus Aenigmarchaeota archaeon]|nr:LamG domain-containing protein [Candidatus Aenigmarchaeota archaeon]